MGPQAQEQYTVKKGSDFSVLSRDVTFQALPGWEYCNLIIHSHREFGKVTSLLGLGKPITFFHSVFDKK
jgi:hypothetical protein